LDSHAQGISMCCEGVCPEEDDSLVPRLGSGNGRNLHCINKEATAKQCRRRRKVPVIWIAFLVVAIDLLFMNFFLVNLLFMLLLHLVSRFYLFLLLIAGIDS
jgi:hypothetical protein